ncbi:MAG TPA: hypothetical protein VGL61_24425 [Kofleriaceae bacterium]
MRCGTGTLGNVWVRTLDASFGMGATGAIGGGLDGLGGVRAGTGACCGPLGGTVADVRRGGSWMPVGGALRLRARGGSGGNRRPQA